MVNCADKEQNLKLVHLVRLSLAGATVAFVIQFRPHLITGVLLGLNK